MPKDMIRRISPKTLEIPEVSSSSLAILFKMTSGTTLESKFGVDWQVALSNGFQKTNDADLLNENKRDWPVFEGRSIHQFNHTFARPEFTADMLSGLRREEKKRVYKNDCRGFYHSFRLAFRDIARSTDMRTVIAAIIPPQTFHVHNLYSFVLSRGGVLEGGDSYNREISYLCGVLNSMTFDFAARAKVQMHVAQISKSLPAPPPERRVLTMMRSPVPRQCSQLAPMSLKDSQSHSI